MYMTNEEWEQNNQDYLKESYEETGFTIGGYVDCLQLLPHHLADAFLQPIRLFCRKDTLHQKLLAAG